MNKIYLYKHKFDEDAKDTENGEQDEDRMYDKSNNKLKIKCQKLFSEDELAEVPEQLRQKWQDTPAAQSTEKVYSRDLVFERFKFNCNRHGTDEAQEERKFELDDEEFGQQLWGIGYISSDYVDERDDEEMLDDEDELFEEAELGQKIRNGQELSASQMETVWYSTRLRDIYNNRWWSVGLQSFFVQYNYDSKPMRAGEQVFYQYGNRSDDYLVEQYGFSLDPGQNPFSNWKFRLLVGVSPTGEIENVDELIPS